MYLLGYAVASRVTGQENVWLGDVSQIVPPLAFASLAFAVARRSARQVRVFWSLNAVHGILWAIGQGVRTYYDVHAGGVPIVSPTDPIFFAASIPLAAALYGRPDRDRPRWLFDIVVLDIVLIALFATFTYAYFVVSVAVTDGSGDVYNRHLAQLFNVRNLLLTLWAVRVWHTAASAEWRAVLGVYAAGLGVTFLGGIAYDVAEASGVSAVGSLWDMVWMIPYAILGLAAARAFDARLFEPAEPEPPLSRLPVVSLVAIALLVLIPAIDEAARWLLDASPVAGTLRTRIALGMMIPFGVVVFVREFLSRRALLRAGQQLVATRAELAHQEKLAAVGKLVSGVAHELNNPLQGVLGYAELLTLCPRDGASEEVKALQDNANRAAAIVRNLVTFAGRPAPDPRWGPIDGIIREAATCRAPSLDSAGIALRLQLADRLPPVYVDADRLKQVFLNLFENAQAAIEARNRRDEAHSGADHVPGEIVVTAAAAADPDRVVIDVADNGSGVRPDELGKLFDPFFTTRAANGTGLGLSVCYGIVREHGGLISARNREAGGAVFTIELPVSHDVCFPSAAFSRDLEGHGRRTPGCTISGAKPRALVVDDEDSNAALLRRALGHAGYDVDSTTLSRRALAMIERSVYDVVISDVKMPELNGQELFTRACQLRPEMSRRFVFITGDIDGEDTLAFLEGSNCTYFMKPFNLERLTSAVNLLVKEARDGGRIS